MNSHDDFFMAITIGLTLIATTLFAVFVLPLVTHAVSDVVGLDKIIIAAICFGLTLLAVQSIPSRTDIKNVLYRRFNIERRTTPDRRLFTRKSPDRRDTE
ncbi:MAG: hypothetical protein H6867_06800 [Rhodospirillales bacterium]|nr:hypothetical protein [Rhodospirillales bacterium]MCB9995258.1 hypothetical protein [Rhodospirillales bacterium]